MLAWWRIRPRDQGDKELTGITGDYGCIITIDAMGTQTEIARQIVARGADYGFCVSKQNHPVLCAQVKAWFEAAQSREALRIEHSHDHRVEAGHHRREMRTVGPSPCPKSVDFMKCAAMDGIANRRHGSQNSTSLE